MAPRLLLTMLCLALAGCAGAPQRVPPPVIEEPALTLALNGLLCRVEPECAKLQLQVFDRPFEQAEMFPDGRLSVNIGLLLATREEAEIAFVLAHETAHRRLRHRVAISPSTRTRLELEADADAMRALRESNLPAEAGLRLLERLLLKAREAQVAGDGNTDPVNAAATLRGQLRLEALAQIEARVDALRAHANRPTLETPPVSADWQRLLAPYRREADQVMPNKIRADAPASPPSQSPPNDP